MAVDHQREPGQILVECHYCGRRFPELARVTAEDIGRTHPPLEAFQMACGDCLNRIRSISHLVPDRTGQEMARDFSWMVPTFSAVLFAAAVGVAIVRVQGLREVGGMSQLLGVAAVLFGLVLVWNRTRFRYGFTHDLRWSLSSKRVDLAVAVVIAGITVSLLSVLLLR